MALSASSNKKSLGLGFFIGFQAGTNARAVDGYRFFREDILTCLDGGLKVPRPKSGRGCQDHVIDVAGNHLLIGVKADKAPIRRNINLVPMILEEGLPAFIQTVLKGVGHGNEFDVWGCPHHLVGCAGTAPPTSY